MTAGPVPITTPQCCTHQQDVKCVQANSCTCEADNRLCTSVFPSGNCRNWGPTRAPTAPTIMSNVSGNIEEAQEAAQTLCHATPPSCFHQDSPAFSPRFLLRGYEWPALPARSDTAHAVPALTETAALDPAAPAAVESVKRNSNRAQPTDSKTASLIPPANQDIYFTSVLIIGDSDGDSDFIESAKTHP